MPTEPAELEVRHVWVRGHSEHAPIHPGLVISWQHSPIHKVTDSSWTALVLVAPCPGAMLVEWVNADRLEPIRDPAPVDGPVTNPDADTSGSTAAAATAEPDWSSLLRAGIR